MAVTYTWGFPPPEVKDEGDNLDVIKAAHWTIIADDGTNTAYKNGVTYLSSPEGDFTPFNDVTKDNLKSWILNSLGKTEQDFENELLQKLGAEGTSVKVPSSW